MKSLDRRALREKFEHYFADLKAEAVADGARVNKAEEWDRFLERALEESAEEQNQQGAA